MPLKTTDIPRPMVLIAVTYLAGLIIGHWFDLSALATLTVCTGLLAWAGLRYWQSRRIDGPAHASVLPLFLILILLGMAQSARLDRQDAQDAATADRLARLESVILTGTVAEEPRVKTYSIQILLTGISITSVESAEIFKPFHDRIALTVKRSADKKQGTEIEAIPLPGQVLRINGQIQTLEDRRNPSAFDAEAYWRGRGVTAMMRTEGLAQIEVLSAPLSLKSQFYRLTRHARTALGRHMDRELSPEQAALARALFLGESWTLDQHQREPFKQTGLMHILCVSGLHTGFVLLVLMALGRLAGLTPRGCALAGMTGLLAYACLTGLRPPVVRATLMAELILGGLLLARHISPLASFATAAFVTLLIDPRNLLRLDWQMSYLCVGSIFIFGPAIYELLTRRPKDPLLDRSLPIPSLWAFWTRKIIFIPLATTLAIQLGMGPFQLLKFGQINPLLVINNLVGCLLAMLAVFSLTLSTLLCTVAALFGMFGNWIHGFTEALVWLSFQPARLTLVLLTESVEGIARYGATPIHPGVLPLWFMAGYYLLLAGGPWLRNGRDPRGFLDRRQHREALFGITACLTLIIWTPMVPHAGHDLDLYMLDVGQGDGMVIRFPNGKIMVVDAGDYRPFDQGAWTLVPFLNTLGIERIDCLVATHGDADHIGGMASLAGQFPVDLLLHGDGTDRDTRFNRMLRAVIAEKDIHTVRPRTGQNLAGFGPAQVRVLAPDPAARGNDGSIVLEIAYGQTEILLTGDMELRGEHKLIERRLLNDIEVLKVGHHGSLSSTSGPFLAVCRPELALISVGEGNRFGHPGDAVLERLDRMNTQSLRTDQLGALWIRTDGHRIQAYRYLGR